MICSTFHFFFVCARPIYSPEPLLCEGLKAQTLGSIPPTTTHQWGLARAQWKHKTTNQNASAYFGLLQKNNCQCNVSMYGVLAGKHLEVHLAFCRKHNFQCNVSMHGVLAGKHLQLHLAFGKSHNLQCNVSMHGVLAGKHLQVHLAFCKCHKFSMQCFNAWCACRQTLATTWGIGIWGPHLHATP